MTAVEEDVPREDDACIGQMDDGVAGRMGRAHLEQRDRAAADLQVESVLERAGGHGERDVLEGERGEDPLHELAGRPERVGRAQHGCHGGRRQVQHLLGTACRGDDLCVTQE